MIHDTREWEKEFDLLASELGLDGHQMDGLRNLQRNQLQKVREDERVRCIQSLKDPLTNWVCTANLEEGDVHNHRTITVCRAIASINSNKTNGF